MSRKHISVVVALLAAAGAAVCGVDLIYAQEAGNTAPPPTDSGGTPPPPPPPPSDTSSSYSGSSGSYTPQSGGEYHPPDAGTTPPPSSGGSPVDTRYAPPPPSGSTSGGEYHPPTGEQRPPEMMGRPAEEGRSGDYKQEYQKEYQRQYGNEVRRQTETRTREMRERFAPPQDSGEFRPKGQPFMEGGRDNAQGRPFTDDSRSQGRPFMGEDMQQGRPFDGGPEGNHGPQRGSGGPEMMGGDRGFGGGGFGGMGGEGDEMMGGPSEEEMEKMQQEQESRMKTEQLRQMKRGMQGLEQGLKQIQRMADKLSKKGITIPADAQALLTELAAARDTVKNATEFTDEVEAAMEVIQDRGQDLGDIGQKLGMLEQLSQMTKQVEKQFAQLDKALAKAKKRKEASQFPAVVAKVEGQISSLKQRWAEVKQGVTSGDADPEDLRDVMEGIFEEVGDAHRAIEMIRQLGSVAKMVRSGEKEIATFEKTIARLRKAGKDVSRLDELLAQGKAKLAEVKSLTSQSGFEPEDLFGLMQELEGIGNEAQDELDRINGKTETKQLQGAVIESLKLRRMGL